MPVSYLGRVLCQSFVVVMCFVSIEGRAGWDELFDEGAQALYQAVEAELLANQAGEKPAEHDANSATESEQPLAKTPSHWQVHIDDEPVFNSRLFSIETGEEHRQTVVLIHGLGVSGLRDWLKVVPALEQRYHVIALDLPGFGLSAKPDGRYSPTNYAKVIEWLVKKYAHGKVVVVGHSMGGAVALRYAADFPASVEKLVLVDAAGILEQTAFVKHSVALPINPDYIPPALTRKSAQLNDFVSYWVEKISAVPDVTEVVSASDMLWSYTFSGQTNANAALALVKEDFTAAIRKLPHETIIIWGRLDRIAPLRTGEMLAGRLANASLFIMENSKHVPMNSHPEEFNRLLQAALEPAVVVNNHSDNNDADNETKVKPAELISKGNFSCNQQDGIVISGRYDTIDINNCTAITLRDVVANKLIIKQSLVEFYNTHVHSDGTALTLLNAVVVATNSVFSGELGLSIDAARIDFAGVSIVGQRKAVEVGEESRLVFSVSDISSETYTGDVHGVYSGAHFLLDNRLAED